MQPLRINLDTGKPTKGGEYPLADQTYSHLLDALTANNFAHTDEALRQDIARYYEGFGLPEPATRIDGRAYERWQKTWVEVNQLRAYALLDDADRAQPQIAMGNSGRPNGASVVGAGQEGLTMSTTNSRR